MEYKKIESVQHLKQLCTDKNINCCIMLNVGVKSSKDIYFDSEDKTWNIINFIDNSQQCLLEYELMDKSVTNIGEAIAFGSFYQII